MAQTLTLNDVPEALGVEEVLQPRHLLFEFAHQPVVGVLVDDGVAADLLGPISVPATEEEGEHSEVRGGKMTSGKQSGA